MTREQIYVRTLDAECIFKVLKNQPNLTENEKEWMNDILKNINSLLERIENNNPKFDI